MVLLEEENKSIIICIIMLIIIIIGAFLVVGSLVIMTLGQVPEIPVLITDVTKDPPSACGVRAFKIHGSKSPVVGL